MTNNDINVEMLQAAIWIKKKPNGITTLPMQRKRVEPMMMQGIADLQQSLPKAFLAKAFMAMVKRNTHSSL